GGSRAGGQAGTAPDSGTPFGGPWTGLTASFCTWRPAPFPLVIRPNRPNRPTGPTDTTKMPGKWPVLWTVVWTVSPKMGANRPTEPAKTPGKSCPLDGLDGQIQGRETSRPEKTANRRTAGPCTP